jgi:surfactin synthase thioesterase subunit
MSQLAYETDEPEKIRLIASRWDVAVPADGIISVEVESILPQASTQAITGIRDGMLIIAFAGTDPVVFADWVSDFNFAPLANGAAKGYSIAAQAAWPKLKSIIEAMPSEATVLLTGHSLGGALAVLISAEIQNYAPGKVGAVYTFGMPRPGLANFSESYQHALGSCTYRLVYGDDIVPTVAPSLLGFRHVGQYLHCARNGKFAATPLNDANGSDDPQFTAEAVKELRNILHRPISRTVSIAQRWKLASTLAMGIGPRDLRRDPVGIAIELLPPRLRDHLPDRYITSISE